jgi:hypothetical protein
MENQKFLHSELYSQKKVALYYTGQPGLTRAASTSCALMKNLTQLLLLTQVLSIQEIFNLQKPHAKNNITTNNTTLLSWRKYRTY